MVIRTLWELNTELWELVEETWLYYDEKWKQLHLDLMLIIKSVLRKSDITLDSNNVEWGLNTEINNTKKFQITWALDEYLMYEWSLELFSQWFNKANMDIFETIIVLKWEWDSKALNKWIRDMRAAAKRWKVTIHPRLNKIMLAILNKGTHFDSYIKSMIVTWELEAKPLVLSDVCQKVVIGFKELLWDTVKVIS